MDPGRLHRNRLPDWHLGDHRRAGSDRRDGDAEAAPGQFRLLFAIHLAARRRMEGRASLNITVEEARVVPLKDV